MFLLCVVTRNDHLMSFQVHREENVLKLSHKYLHRERILRLIYCRCDTRQYWKLYSLHHSNQLSDRHHGDYVADGDNHSEIQAAGFEIAHMIESQRAELLYVPVNKLFTTTSMSRWNSEPCRSAIVYKLT